jgi:hypothetical protein
MARTYTYTPGIGGTLYISTADGTNQAGTTTAVPVQNVTIDFSRGEIDVTQTNDSYVVAMAGRITRKVSCTMLVTAGAETFLGHVMSSTTGQRFSLKFNDGNDTETFIQHLMCTSASRSYDNSGAATISFQFTESVAN